MWLKVSRKKRTQHGNCLVKKKGRCEHILEHIQAQNVQKRHTKHTMDKRQKTSKCPDILRILRDIPHLCTVKHL